MRLIPGNTATGVSESTVASIRGSARAPAEPGVPPLSNNFNFLLGGAILTLVGSGRSVGRSHGPLRTALMGAGSGSGLNVTVGLGREFEIFMLDEATILGRRRRRAVVLILVHQPLQLSTANLLA
jgi:hypothetical protein